MTRIGVVGAGRVGAVLAAAWRAAGHEITKVAGESDASLRRARRLLPGVPLDKPTAVARSCDLLVLTVPDDMLANVVMMLSDAGAIRPGQFVAHTSGRHGLTVLDPATSMGALPIALHPAMTFTGTDRDLGRLPGCVYGVTTALPETLALAESLVTDLKGRIAHVPEENRALYHAGLAHGANHLVTLISQAMEVLRAAGADDPSAMLRPLLSAAMENALESGDASLTGPIVRGDVETVRTHLAEIRRAAPEALESYVALARSTANRAALDGRLTAVRAAKLVGVLNDALAAERKLRGSEA
jgi:predicted short-subunit dehydrogenase-like oxidoreductase (DUF2520 family)